MAKKDYLLGKQVCGLNKYGHIVGEVGIVTETFPAYADSYGNYPLVVQYANGKKKDAMSFWVRKVVCIEVYHDTIERHEEISNLSEVLVTENFARNYFNEYISNKYDGTISFDYWIMNHDADETMDFYQYAKYNDAVIDVKHC